MICTAINGHLPGSDRMRTFIRGSMTAKAGQESISRHRSLYLTDDLIILPSQRNFKKKVWTSSPRFPSSSLIYCLLINSSFTSASPAGPLFAWETPVRRASIFDCWRFRLLRTPRAPADNETGRRMALDKLATLVEEGSKI